MASAYVDAGGKNSGWIEQALPIVRSLPVPSGVESGDIVLIEEMVCYAQSDRDSDGNARVMIPGVFVQVIPVVAKDNTGDKAVEVGYKVYFDDSVTDEINLDNVDGTQFGYALGTVAAGATADIEVAFGL